MAAALGLLACGSEPAAASGGQRDAAALGPPSAAVDAAPSGAVPTDTGAGGSLDDAGGAPVDPAPRDGSSGDTSEDAALAPTDDAIAHYGLDWLDGNVDGGFVTHASVEIDASVERVWQLVRDVNGYARWCSVLRAEAASVSPGEPIRLAIQLGDPGSAPTESDEIIGVVDDARHALSWSRDFGFGQETLRFQVVTQTPRGARYTTALRYPAELGALVIPLLGPNLDRAFSTIAEDLARAAQAP